METNPSTTFLDEKLLPYLFCPGCGHGRILDQLNKALVMSELDPKKVVIVTDIGCAGLSDRYFVTNAFHGLHGRSTTYATGIKLANPDLKVIVLIGDGGCGIGGHHLLNAARRNIGVTTLVFNNLNYGMTGGEHSVTTPPGSITATTGYGQIEYPLDICGTVAANGATFVARTTAFDRGLPDLIVRALRNDGFSLIDIWELCTAHYVPNNRFSKVLLQDTIKKLSYETGIIRDKPRPEYGATYRSVHNDILGQPAMVGRPVEPKYKHGLSEAHEIIIAGAAGSKIGSAASLFGHGALLSGLWATQRDDYPVTVKSGHSITEIIISPTEIYYTGISHPNMMIVLFPEGLAKSLSKIEAMTTKDILLSSADLPEVNTRAKKIIVDFKAVEGRRIKIKHHAIMALSIVLRRFGFYPLDAFKEAISSQSKFSDENLVAVEASKGLTIMVH